MISIIVFALLLKTSYSASGDSCDWYPSTECTDAEVAATAYNWCAETAFSYSTTTNNVGTIRSCDITACLRVSHNDGSVSGILELDASLFTTQSDVTTVQSDGLTHALSLCGLTCSADEAVVDTTSCGCPSCPDPTTTSTPTCTITCEDGSEITGIYDSTKTCVESADYGSCTAQTTSYACSDTDEACCGTDLYDTECDAYKVCPTRLTLVSDTSCTDDMADCPANGGVDLISRNGCCGYDMDECCIISCDDGSVIEGEYDTTTSLCDYSSTSNVDGVCGCSDHCVYENCDPIETFDCRDETYLSSSLSAAGSCVIDPDDCCIEQCETADGEVYDGVWDESIVCVTVPCPPCDCSITTSTPTTTKSSVGCTDDVYICSDGKELSSRDSSNSCAWICIDTGCADEKCCVLDVNGDHPMTECEALNTCKENAAGVSYDDCPEETSTTSSAAETTSYDCSDTDEACCGTDLYDTECDAYKVCPTRLTLVSDTSCTADMINCPDNGGVDLISRDGCCGYDMDECCIISCDDGSVIEGEYDTTTSLCVYSSSSNVDRICDDDSLPSTTEETEATEETGTTEEGAEETGTTEESAEETGTTEEREDACLVTDGGVWHGRVKKYCNFCICEDNLEDCIDIFSDIDDAMKLRLARKLQQKCTDLADCALTQIGLSNEAEDYLASTASGVQNIDCDCELFICNPLDGSTANTLSIFVASGVVMALFVWM